MSNLRLLSEHSATGVNNVSVNNIFTDDYSIYKVVLYELDQSSTGGSHNNVRFLTPNGAEVYNAIYDYSQLQIKSYQSFGTDKYLNQRYIRLFNQVTGGTEVGLGAVMYFFNPTNENAYTYARSQSIGFYAGGGALGYKGIGALKQASRITGLKFFTETTSTTYDSIKFRVYGMRVD